MGHEVFISYAIEDKLIADAICAKLEENKIRCWIAPRDILPGEKYASALLNAIDQSEIILVVFSSNADKSPHVRNEVERAFNKEKIIIPFRIENIEPCDEMQYFIGSRHWLDALSPPLEAHINDLIKVLKSNIIRFKEGMKIENNIKNNTLDETILPDKINYSHGIYRIGSYLIDLVIGLIFGFCIFVIGAMISVSAYGSNYNNLTQISPGINSSLGNFIAWTWWIGGMILWVFLNDRYKKLNLGKKLLKLTIVNLSQNTKSSRWLTIRSLVKVIPLIIFLIGLQLNTFDPNSTFWFFAIVLQIVWGIPIFFTDKSQSVHDLIAGTVVCKK
jgi:uncharacterized RDD family membrane protein YckC